MQETCLVIPCFNEEKRLRGGALLEWLGHRDGLSVCLVNDGSTDGTAQILESLRQQNPARILLLDLPVNRGKAEAVRQGVIYASATGRFGFLGYWDADLSTPLDQVDGLLGVLVRNPACMLVLGSRVRRLGSHIERRTVRHVIGRIFATLASQLLGLPVYDSQCGAKVLRDEVVVMLFGDPFVTRWLFDVELLARLRNALGAKGCLAAAQEEPLQMWTEVGGSKIRVSHILRVPYDLLKIWATYNRRSSIRA